MADTIKFSRETGAFYPADIAYKSYPEDCFEVPIEDFHLAMNRACDEALDIENGRIKIVKITHPPPTNEQIVGALTMGVQVHLDAQARAMGYDDLRTAVTYADEPSVPKFQAEGRALRAWRSAVWAYCYELLDQVAAGTHAVPTIEELLAGLPAFEMPA